MSVNATADGLGNVTVLLEAGQSYFPVMTTPTTTTIKLARSPATLAQVLQTSLVKILCVHNIIQERATCSQSQRSVQSLVSAAC